MQCSSCHLCEFFYSRCNDSYPILIKTSEWPLPLLFLLDQLLLVLLISYNFPDSKPENNKKQSEIALEELDDTKTILLIEENGNEQQADASFSTKNCNGKRNEAVNQTILEGKGGVHFICDNV